MIGIKKILSLQKEMKEHGLLEKDLEEKTIYGHGKGGQKVNKSHNCVFLRHVPTGLFTKCHKSRFLKMNKFFARRKLLDMWKEKVLHGKSDKEKKEQKVRKQKLRNFKRARKKSICIQKRDFFEKN